MLTIYISDFGYRLTSKGYQVGYLSNGRVQYQGGFYSTERDAQIACIGYASY